MYPKYAACILLTFISSLSCTASDDLKKRIEKLYDGVTGFGIDSEEENNILLQDGAPTYGEITYDSLKKLIDDLHLTADDVFYDLGSGVGKVTLQVFLDSPVKKSVGIELSPTRHARAKKVQRRMERPNILEKTKGKLQDWGLIKTPLRKLEYRNQNILDADLDGATVIFMCSTCFSDKLMDELTKKLSKLKKGLRVLTLKKLPESSDFTLIKTYMLPMTWSSGSSVYLYKLKG